MIKEFCNLIAQENILVYNLKFSKNASVYLKINKSFILNYLLAANTPRLTKRTPGKSRQAWMWMDMPGHTQPKLFIPNAAVP